MEASQTTEIVADAVVISVNLNEASAAANLEQGSTQTRELTADAALDQPPIQESHAANDAAPSVEEPQQAALGMPSLVLPSSDETRDQQELILNPDDASSSTSAETPSPRTEQSADTPDPSVENSSIGTKRKIADLESPAAKEVKVNEE